MEIKNENKNLENKEKPRQRLIQKKKRNCPDIKKNIQ